MRIITGLSLIGTVLFFCFGPFDPYNPAPERSGENDTSTTPSTRHPKGLVGWWTCDDSAGSTVLTDSSDTDSVRESNGQISGCSRGEGKSGLALSFNGKSDYVLIPSTKDSLFDFGTGDFTISVWVKPAIIEVNPDSMNYGIITKGVARDRGYGLYIERNRFSAFVGQFKSGSNDTIEASDNEWHHCVMLRRNRIVELYVDGNNTQFYDNGDNVTTNIKLLFGQDASSEKESNFPGLIDEIKIFNTAWGKSDVTNEFQRFKVKD